MLEAEKRITLIKYFTYLSVLILVTLLVGACSTKRNTLLSRSYHALNTRYNVYFNGYTSYDDGMANINKATKDDYSSIIAMYPISNHAAAQAAISDMNRTIEKCRKAIKLHSIKVKPAKNYKKANDPDYKLYYNQEEFNPVLKHAWLLLGQAEFHKAEFLGSVGTFSYVIRHFSTDKDLVIACQLWIVRAYAEMGWIFEAEQMLSKVSQDNLRKDNVGLFSSVNADLLLKKKQYKDAIPFLEMSLSKESNRYLRQRFNFLLAQLYQATGDENGAYKAYHKVLRMNPPYEMDFNAQIGLAQLGASNTVKVRKKLQKMLRSRNNQEYLDQIYYALGKNYLQHGDTLQALKNFKLSADTSSRNGIEKARTLISMGDLYYQKRKYVPAQPCYQEASQILNNDHEDYVRVTHRAEALSDVVKYYEIVQLQDSLQRLAKMPETDRKKVVEKVIAQKEAAEKAAEAKVRAESQKATVVSDDDLPTTAPIGAAATNTNWYFYSLDVVRSGQTQFTKKWGHRKLEDDWRRSSKAAELFSEEPVANATAAVSPQVGDSVAGKDAKSNTLDDKSPEFYLRQIPVTPTQLEKSNVQWSDALYAMASAYQDKVEDYELATNSYHDFMTRFPADKRVADAYYQLYMMQVRQGHEAQAEVYRLKIVTDYPESRYAKVLATPNYSALVQRMYAEQDSLYASTYSAFNKSDYQTVFDNTESFRKNFSLSPLVPKFMLLNALSIGKNGTAEHFKSALEELVTKYPSSDVSAMAKDLLALKAQGLVNKAGTSGGSLLSRANEDGDLAGEQANSKPQFSTDLSGRHRLLLVCKATNDKMTQLQYVMASYNFSHFVVKDFDLIINKLDTARNALSVTNLESYAEAEWYKNNLKDDGLLVKVFNEMGVQPVIISEENLIILKNNYSLEEYLAFEAGIKHGSKSQVLPHKAQVVTPETQVPSRQTTATVPAQKLQSAENVQAPVPPVKVAAALEPKQGSTEVAEPVPTAGVKTVIEPQLSVPKLPVQAEEKSAAIAVGVDPAQPLFKGLFAYNANEPHWVAVYVLSATADLEKAKSALTAYHKANYATLNLSLQHEKQEKTQMILIGPFANAATSKEYLLKMVRDKSVQDGVKGLNYRNLLGSRKNLDILVKQDALNTYFEFMQQYYLK